MSNGNLVRRLDITVTTGFLMAACHNDDISKWRLYALILVTIETLSAQCIGWEPVNCAQFKEIRKGGFRLMQLTLERQSKKSASTIFGQLVVHR